ncbi:hypothetical protein JCGZ_14916 [Jatropha curcas]|uniref:Uncharacterized protein n=1 Tax=Jatropha curcas TaxID=180498 RepID=A0A067LNF9_JATCU|nr:hypothetical protein JCGZ_14916 [Jatropha curcas]
MFANKSKISSLKNWKSKFFIVKHSGGFRIPNQWTTDPLRRQLASPTLYDEVCVVMIKARGLRSVDLKQVITEGYLTSSPNSTIIPNPGMAPKKAKSSKIMNVAEAMRKQACG